jgi:hypothetical protein
MIFIVFWVVVMEKEVVKKDKRSGQWGVGKGIYKRLATPVFADKPDDVKAKIAWNRENGFPDVDYKKRKWCALYLENFNIAHACRELGVSRPTGYAWYREPVTSAYLDWLSSRQVDKVFLTKEQVQLEQIDVLDKLMGREAVPMMKPNGEMVLDKKFHGMEVVKFLGDLAKQTGAVVDQRNHNGGSGGVSININLGALGIEEKIKEVIDVSKSAE